MKWPIFLFVLSLLNSTSAQKFVAGKTVRGGRTLIGYPSPEEVCASTTSTLTFCKESDPCAKNTEIFTCHRSKVISASPCPDSKPYCIGERGTQICAAYPDPMCLPKTPICRQPGYFPDPLNCLNYFYCYYDPQSSQLLAVQKTCPEAFPFSPAGPQDQKCQLGGTCETFSCEPFLDQQWSAVNWYNYTYNRMALYCEKGKADYMFECPAGLSLDLTFTTYPRCVIQCIEDYQKAVYPADSRKYYLCLGGKAMVEICEIGQVFIAEKLSCGKL